MCIFGTATRLCCVELRNSNKKPQGGYKQPTKGCGVLVKGRGRGINSSQSKNVGKIQLSKQLSHLSIIFENIWF